MSRAGVRALILGEDQAHQNFARRVLLDLGFHHREIVLLPLVGARGAADQSVLRRYPDHVRAQRSRVKSQAVGLIVVIDADAHTVRDRKSQLDEKLAESGMELRQPSEGIVAWVPKRNIETWLVQLEGGEANEQDDYKHRVKTRNYRDQARTFVRYYRDNEHHPPNLVPSMLDAFEETGRIPVS